MNYYEEIKQELINNEVYKRVKDYSKNKNDLETYYNVGKILVNAQGGEEKSKYGDKLIKEYSNKLKKEFGKGYSTTTLKYMRQFYLFCKKSQAVPDQLTWSHYIELLKLKDIDEINYYIDISIKQNMSYRELRRRIKNNEYSRLSDDVKRKLIIKEETKISDFIKNPIVIKNSYNYTEVTEKVLKQLILEDIDSFLKELGDGFCYIKNEYNIKIVDKYNYIDLLLFNYIYNCFIVVELKVTELKKEHIGQIQVYMNYIDKNIKSINQSKTIGIIICKRENQLIMEYVSDDRIFETEFILN